MEKIFFKSDEIELENVGAGINRKISATGGTLMVVEVDFEEGSIGSPHKHIHEQATYVLSGEFEFTVGDKTMIVKAGDSIYMPSDILHGAKCLKAGKLLDIFTPQREDFLLNSKDKGEEMKSKKVAVITGATRGIGLAAAEALGKDGYTVIVNGILEDEGREVIKELVSKGIEAELHLCDITNEEAVNEMIKVVGEKYGHIDTIVNNAGGLGGREKFEGMTTEFYRRVMALNLDSTLFVSRAAIPYLKNSKNNPSIINYTSIAAYNGGGPGAGIYAAAKGAVLTMTRAMAKELISSGIRVNAISPGTIDTAFHSATNRDIMETWKSGIAIGRFGESKEVADIISFLASDKASYLVGEVIQINGGQAYL